MPSRWGVFALCLVAAAGSARAAATDAHSVTGLSRSLAVAESRSGRASPRLLPLLDRLAGAQFHTGALAEAAASRRRALDIALHAYGGGSMNAANAMIALADVEILRERYVEAEPLLSTALPVIAAQRGSAAPALARPLAALARVALARGDAAAAEAFAGRAAALVERGPAAASSEPLRALGAAYAAQDRFADGERVLQAAVTRDRRTHGADSPQLARSLAQLADLRLRAGRFAEALPVIEQAIAIDQENLGPSHPLIADDFADLGLVYGGLGRDDDAAAALYFAVGLLSGAASEETPRLGYAELDLAGVLRRLGQGDDADAAFKDAKRILDAAANDERERDREI